MNDRNEREVRLACFVLPVRAGQVLLARHTYGSLDLWAMIGGMAEPGEAPHEAAVREVLEETGLVVHGDRLLAVVDRDDILMLVFLGRVVSGNESPQVAEIAELRWFSLEEIDRINSFDLVRQLVPPLATPAPGFPEVTVAWPDGARKPGLSPDWD